MGQMNGAAELQNVQETDALASLVARLEEDVILGRLHPRERLVEDELMDRFAAKRHLVREALATLDRMGLVERRKNVGALVRSFTTEEVKELYHLRSLLETEAARLIPLPPSDADLAQLVAVQRQHDAAAAAGDARRLFRLNQRFHQKLFSMTGNQTLLRAIDEYARQTHAIRFMTLSSPAYRERARLEHWQIIEALRAGDRKALVALCKAHLRPARDAYLEAARQCD